MKYPPEHKEEIHQRLLNHASEQIREVGLSEVSVKSVMEAEGMTVGGFYAHFDSKDDMLIKAIEFAFAKTYESFYDRLEDRANDSWAKKVIERYLSDYHRDVIQLSCPLATLMSDIARADEHIRAEFETHLKAMIHQFEKRIGKSKAIGLFAMLAGGLQLSRAVNDEAYSEQILKSCIRSARSLIKER